MEEQVIKIKTDNNKSKKLLLFFVVIILFVLIAGTYAWLSNRLDDTALVLTFGNLDGLSVTVKPYKLDESLSPVSGYTYGKYIDVTANNRTSSKQGFSLYYEISEISNELKSNDFRYQVMRSTDSGSTYSVVGQGNFSTANTTNDFVVYEEKIPGNTIYLYKVYIWIQESGGDQTSLQNKTFTGEFRASFSGDILPLAPVLDAAMIPVTIANDGTVSVVSKDDPEWYNYDTQKWANVVLVKENATSGVSGSHSRADYLAASLAGTPNYKVVANDILAYYVWIPRYSYKIWYTGTSTQNGNEQLIEIKFINKDTIDTGASVNSMRTHPAFSFNGTELAGIWLAKFEPSHTSSATTNLSCSSATCSASDNVRILPNKASLRNNSVASFFYATKSMQRSGSIFGLSGSNTDSHLVLNSEWGAAAYLSHSSYGSGNVEIRINNNSNYTTGCGASTPSGAKNSSCQIAYGGVSDGAYPQSTTGNITGIFDMSGCGGEYTMSNYNNTIAQGGFSSLPSAYYYNMYNFTSLSSCTIATCGGHGLTETYNWYSDTTEALSTSKPWYIRGGTFQDTTSSGIFFSQSKEGPNNNFRSARFAIIVK